MIRRGGTFLALAALSLFLTAGRGVSPGDESWFLLVAKRVAAGDHLYRDVFYSPLPLAVWVTALPVAAFGAQIAVVEALVAVVWAATAVLVARVARGASGGSAAGLLAVAALVVVAPPQRNSLYTPLAMLLLLATLTLALRLAERPSPRVALAAGCAAGLSFAAKQTIGLAALAALLLSLALARRAGTGRAAAAALAGFAVVAAAVAVALTVSGDVGDAVTVGFTGKGGYLAHGSLSYPRALWDAARLLPSQPAGAFDNLPPLLAPLVAVALVAAAGRRALSAAVLVPAVFAVAAVAGAYPRFSATHLAWADAAVVAAAAAAAAPWLAARRSLRAAAAAPLVLGCAVALSLVPLAWARGQLTFSSLPSFSGMPIERGAEDDGVRLRRAIRAGDPILFVTDDAGFYALVTGARNPTAYDVPATSNIGPKDVASVVASVDDGRLRQACFGGSRAYRGEPSLRPLPLERALARAMRRVADLGPCVLYVR